MGGSISLSVGLSLAYTAAHNVRSIFALHSCCIIFIITIISASEFKFKAACASIQGHTTFYYYMTAIVMRCRCWCWCCSSRGNSSSSSPSACCRRGRGRQRQRQRNTVKGLTPTTRNGAGSLSLFTHRRTHTAATVNALELSLMHCENMR